MYPPALVRGISGERKLRARPADDAHFRSACCDAGTSRSPSPTGPPTTGHVGAGLVATLRPAPHGGAILRLGPLAHEAAWLARKAFLGRPLDVGA